MTVGVPKESYPGETRVALVPKHIPALTKAGCSVQVEAGAGEASGIEDSEYADKGATIVTDRKKLLSDADVLLTVRSAGANPDKAEAEAKLFKEGALVIGFLSPYEPHKSFEVLKSRKISSMSMELIPRITRAQSMDALSSMANLAGYKAVLLAGAYAPQMFPMMMTAAGTIPPAKIFIVGVGVAGLQAIATGKRLGAVVRAYDIRPAVKEQVESLGARFVEMKLDTGDAEGKGGYAKEMDEEFYKKQREMMMDVVADSDIVITTAAIPGKPSPRLVTKEMVDGMKRGSIIIDLAAERGGNCELTKAGEEVNYKGVRIHGPLNIPASLPANASDLYSKNTSNLLTYLIKEGVLTLDSEDEIVQATLVTHAGDAPNEAIRDRLELGGAS